MKSYIPIVVLIIILISGCNAFKADDPTPDYDYSNSFLPLKKGNTWTYARNNNIEDSVITKATGDNFMQGFQTFYGVTNSRSDGTYYSQNDNEYYMFLYPDIGPPFAIPILDTRQYEGYAVTTKDSTVYSNDATPTLATMTIVENGFSMTVNGRNYNNVIHTYIDVEEAFNENYMSVETYDLYFVKGIGLIEIDKGNAGFIYETLTLINYKLE